MDIDELRQNCSGVVAARGESNFAELIHGNLWNRLIPDRAPEAVVRAQTSRTSSPRSGSRGKAG